MTLSPELEATLRRYALGRLAEEPRLAFEERLVTEPDVLEALGVVEEELTEEYLERSLSEDERRDYEQSFLASAERQRLLGFVDSLKARASRRQPAPLPARRVKPWSWQPAWALAASMLLALSVTLNFWQGRRLAAPDAPATAQAGAPTPSTATPDSVQPAASVAVLSPPPTAPALQEEVVPRLRQAVGEPRGPGPSVASFLLAAGVLRGSGSMTRVSVPERATGVRLLLPITQAEYSLYRATLRDAEGGELWTAARLQALEVSDRTAVVLLLPSELLPRGDYLIELAGVREGGEPEPLASYAFRVTTP